MYTYIMYVLDYVCACLFVVFAYVAVVLRSLGMCCYDCRGCWDGIS